MNPTLSRTILLLIIILSGCSKPAVLPPTIPKPVVLKPNRFTRSEEQKRDLLAKMAVNKGDKIEKSCAGNWTWIQHRTL
jgi:hypothetical protein